MEDRKRFIASLSSLKAALLEDTGERQAIFLKAEQHNPWFIQPFLQSAMNSIVDQFLDEKKCADWLSQYPEPVHPGQRIGLIMAGNIPLVGFHDLFCVLASGHRAIIKLSDKDSYLIPFVLDRWKLVYPEIEERVSIVEKLDGIDAIIATGSNNSGRYFEYYFGKYPHVFRSNRNAVAVLTGKESSEEIKALGTDIFSYFGLGCRNVSKVYVPAGYDFGPWQNLFDEWSFLSDHNKYRNNLDYNYAIYLINSIPHIHLGNLILKEDQAIVSRIGSLHYSFYANLMDLEKELDTQRESIQCLISSAPITPWDHVRPGGSQEPALGQYADGVDTMAFLTAL